MKLILRSAFLFGLAGFVLNSCAKKSLPSLTIQDLDYVSVLAFGAKVNDGQDDRSAIQKAFDSGKNIYFPTGTYLLESKSSSGAMLEISEKNFPENLFFEDGAVLLVSENQPRDYAKTAVVRIMASADNITSININGITIEGQRELHPVRNTGLLIYEKTGAAVQKVTLSNARFNNLGGDGIHTQARSNYFYNIQTKNCGNHGIGIINTTNRDVKSTFFLDGYTSVNDDGYSIDFSGHKLQDPPHTVFEGYAWSGMAKNIVSINSGYGIKTAGHWNLSLENVRIEDSRNNGFFINSDAVGYSISVKNMSIARANSTGVSLAGNTHFSASHLTIDSCPVGLSMKQADVDIDSLFIDGGFQEKACIRMGKGDTAIRNFKISKASDSDQYPIWVDGSKVVMENGIFEEFASPYVLIIQEEAGEVFFNNLQFHNFSRKEINGILSVQKSGNTRIENCDFNPISGKKIDDRTKSILLKNNRGLD